jgi:hypothetical protein
MAMSAQVARWSGRKLYPLKAPHLAQRRTINLPPNVEYDAGQIVSLAGAAANDVQTISDTGTITAGTFTISGQNPITGAAFTTGTIAYNANNAAVKAALEAVLLTGITVTVAGSGLPGSDTTLTFSGSTAGRPVPLMTINSTGLTGGTLAVAHTTPGRTAGTFVGNATDAKGFLEYPVRTDAFGNVFHADAPAGLGGEATTTMYYSGTFATEDVTGLTTDALAALGGFLVAGSINGPGEFRF